MYWFTDQDRPLPFPASSTNKRMAPITENVRMVWSQIVKRAKENHAKGIITEIFFHYSGHGSSRATDDVNDVNGEDQCMCLLDKPLWNDEFCKGFLYPLPSSAFVTLLLDACHSEGAASLPYQFNIKSKQLNQETDFTDISANIMQLTGCRFNQTSAAGMSSAEMSALTRSFLEILTRKGSSGIRAADFVRMLRVDLLNHSQRQLPMLSFSHNKPADIGSFVC
jgi:hypothetical protein